MSPRWGSNWDGNIFRMALPYAGILRAFSPEVPQNEIMSIYPLARLFVRAEYLVITAGGLAKWRPKTVGGMFFISIIVYAECERHFVKPQVTCWHFLIIHCIHSQANITIIPSATTSVTMLIVKVIVSLLME